MPLSKEIIKSVYRLHKLKHAAFSLFIFLLNYIYIALLNIYHILKKTF